MVHKKQIEGKTRGVGNEAPLVSIKEVLNPEELMTLQRQTRQLDIDNMHILTTLMNVHITEGNLHPLRMLPKSKPKVNSGNDFRKQVAERIKRENQMMAECLRNVVPEVPTTASLNQNWRKIIELGKIKPLPKTGAEGNGLLFKTVCPKKEQYITAKSRKYPDKRPRVLFEITGQNGLPMGSMIAVLYSDFLPIITSQFLKTLSKGRLRKRESYFLYAILPRYYCMGGIEGSLYKTPFERDDCNPFTHGQPGILSAYDIPTKVNGTQIVITFDERKIMDEDYFPFGKIEKGFKTLRLIESVGTVPSGYPKMKLYISNIKEI